MGWFSKKVGDADYVDAEKAVEAVPVYAPATHNQSPHSGNNTKTSAVQQNLPRVPTVLQTCPHCQKTRCLTRIRTAPNWMTCLIALVLLFVFWPICWIPFVTDAMKRTDHYCQHCNNVVGSVEPFQDCCVKHRT